jgi:nitroreductase
MEGFSPGEVDEILNLKERGLKSVLLLPLGYRNSESDWLVNLTKVRKSKEHFITEIN